MRCIDTAGHLIDMCHLPSECCVLTSSRRRYLLLCAFFVCSAKWKEISLIIRVTIDDTADVILHGTGLLARAGAEGNVLPKIEQYESEGK